MGKTLGKFLQEKREEIGVTQTQLALKLGWKQATVSAIEVGRNGIRADHLSRWMLILNLSEADKLRALRLALDESEPQEAEAA